MTENISAYMEQVARHYWGEPTGKHGAELRWGTHGSRSVDLRKGTWYDFELKEGGGVIDLVRREHGAGFRSVPEILEREFGIPRQKHESLKPREWLSKVYEYYDEDGVLSYQVLRYEPKTFRQRRPDDKGGWIWSIAGVEPVPYNLPALLKRTGETIFVCEGEKDVDTLTKVGLLATTNNGGAANFNEKLAKYFEGRRVVFLPHNDEAGEQHVKVAAPVLNTVGAQIRVLRLPGLAPKGDVSDWLPNHDRGELIALAKAAPEWIAPKIAEPLPLPADDPALPEDVFPTLGIAALRAMQPPEWLVEGVLVERAFAALYGEPGAGKSFLALDLALSLAHGLAWQGRGTARVPALYIAGEGVGGLGQRIKAWQAWHGLGGTDAPFFVLPQAVLLSEGGDVERLLRTIDALDQRFGLVVVDTVARSMSGDENSAENMGEFVRACDAIKGATGGALLAIHHAGKDATRGLRGSNALLGALDSNFRVTRAGDVLSLKCEKQKDAEMGDDLAFDLAHVAIIGGSSLVPVLRQGGPVPGGGTGGGGKLPGAAFEALKALKNVCADNGKRVSRQLWLDEHLRQCPDASGTVRRNARDLLQRRGIVATDSNAGLVWIVEWAGD